MNPIARTFAHVLVASLLVACGSTKEPVAATTEAPVAAPTPAPAPSPREQVRQLLASIETGDPAPIAYINPTSYTQHNLAVPDGLAGFGETMKALPEGSAKAKVARVFVDGDYVFAHTDYDFFGPKIGFDIFRFEDGKIVEHWDNLQEKAESPNPSGRTMIDGATEVQDLDKTEANKELVRNFVDDILVNGDMSNVGDYIGETYLQHNPGIGDGLDGLSAAVKAMAEQGLVLKYDTVHTILGEGNFVLTVSESVFGGKPTSFYDLFRIEDGKIVEHWDVIETIAPKEEWKNDNGKFGF
ncbi:MAG: nuclear transport factor 2 family protein [Myxococcota bacterium]